MHTAGKVGGELLQACTEISSAVNKAVRNSAHAVREVWGTQDTDTNERS